MTNGRRKRFRSWDKVRSPIYCQYVWEEIPTLFLYFYQQISIGKLRICLSCCNYNLAYSTERLGLDGNSSSFEPHPSNLLRTILLAINISKSFSKMEIHIVLHKKGMPLKCLFFNLYQLYTLRFDAEIYDSSSGILCLYPLPTIIIGKSFHFVTWLLLVTLFQNFKAYLDNTPLPHLATLVPSNTVTPQGTLLPLFPASEGVATIKFNCWRCITRRPSPKEGCY